MHTKITGASILSLAFFAAIIGLFTLPLLPAEVASHWNAAGQVDDYMPKLMGVFLMPCLLLVVFIVWKLIPRIEPMQKNFLTFRESYNGFFLVLAFFLFYVYDITIGTNLGWQFDFRVALAPAVALLLFAVAELMKHTKRNFLVGIRTPWTLSSDKVWKRTHELAAYLFYFCAISALAGAVYPDFLMVYILVPILGTVLITVLYSYIEFKRVGAK